MRRGRILAAGAVMAVLGSTGAAHAAPLPLTGTLDLGTDADTLVHGPVAGAHAGASVAAVGDVNGDGAPDTILGGPRADPAGRREAGSAWVVFGDPARPGRRNEPVDLAALGTVGFRIDGAQAGDEAGFDVAPAGDVNRDGLADVLVGARLADPAGRRDAGAAYVVFGRRGTAPVDLAALGDGGIAISGPKAGDQLGFSVDSAPAGAGAEAGRDLLLGAPRTDVAPSEGLDGIDTGSVLVVHAPAAAGTVDGGDLGTSGYRIDADRPGLAGWSVAALPDATGDGRPEIAIGAPFTRAKETFDGAAYVVFGRAADERVDLGTLGDGGYSLRGAGGEVAGGTVAAAGDLDGDGIGDLAVAGQLADADDERTDTGRVFVVPGRATGGAATDLSAVTGGETITGAAKGDELGASVAGVGDYDGDGRPDLLLGAPFADALDREDAGAAYVVFGTEKPADLDLSLLGRRGVRLAGGGERDYAGVSGTGLGDLTGDGRAEVMVGSLFASPRDRKHAGSAAVVLGPEPPKPDPIDALPPDPGAAEEVSMDGCHSVDDIEAIIDDSGSMSGTDPLSLRARALKILITKPRNTGERLGAIEFGSEAAELFFPLRLGTNAFKEERDRLLALVDERVQADSGSTNYNAAFAAAAEQNPDAGARIFLTDGGHNEGKYRGLHRGGPRTYVVGLGIGRTGLDARRLKRIAAQTGGAYYPNVGAEELQPVLNAIDSRLNCDTELSKFEDVLTGDDASEEHSEELDEGTHSSDVTVSWEDPDDDFTVDALEYVDEDDETVARFSARRLARVAARPGRRFTSGGVTVTGIRAETYTTFRLTGLREGRLNFKVRNRRVKARRRAKVTAQVAESRRRR